MLGLDIARRLASCGETVAVWESSEQVGGLAAPWRVGSVVWDRFYHVIAGADAELLELLKILGLESQVRWVKAQTGFYTDGRLHPFSSILDFAAFPALNPVEKVRLGLSIVYASRVNDWRALEEITAVEWLTRLCGRGVVERIWLPLLRAKLGENAQRVSAAFIWTIIKRMYGARRNAARRECFGFIPDGYARILGKLTEHLRDLHVDIRSSVSVAKVERIPDGRVLVRSRDGSAEAFDDVVLTLPAALAAGLCPQLAASERRRLTEIDYQGVICASLLLRQPLSPFYITNITDPAPFTAVIEIDALTGTQQFGGNALVYLPKYLPSSDPMFALDDRTIEDAFFESLLRMYPSLRADDIVASRIARAKYVLPLSTLQYSQRIPPFTTSIPHLYVANSTQILNGTLNVNQTLELAKQATATIQGTRLAQRLEACA